MMRGSRSICGSREAQAVHKFGDAVDIASVSTNSPVKVGVWDEIDCESGVPAT
jgi:hypothetical protein